eukprot:1216508-Amphidinium_carterae.1
MSPIGARFFGASAGTQLCAVRRTMTSQRCPTRVVRGECQCLIPDLVAPMRASGHMRYEAEALERCCNCTCSYALWAQCLRGEF